MNLRVIISGRTAVGKSTHGKLLARDLDVPYFSATDHLTKLVSQRTGAPREQRWQPSLDAARQADTSIDDELDAEMARLFLEASSGVFDACLLPWVVPDGQAVRVWLESGLDSRVRKCIVSHWDEQITVAQARERVVRKDSFTEDRLVDSRGHRYHPQQDRFEVIISNDDLIPVATPAAAEAGIASFRPTVLDAILFVAGERAVPPTTPWLLFSRPMSS